MSARDLEMARLAELSVERWLEGLEAPESIEFERLRASYPGFDVESLADVAATLSVAPAGSPEILPERVRLSLANAADAYFGPKARPSPSVAAGDLPVGPTAQKRGSWLAYGGWLTAAASILVSVYLRLDPAAPVAVVQPAAPPPTASQNREAPPSPMIAASQVRQCEQSGDNRSTITARAEAADPVMERAQFMKTHSWLFQRPLLPGPDPTGEAVTGDVVWDPKSQTGYLNFHRLRRNNPNIEQYQLWIFDAQRDQRFPVDGGVFNVSTASGDEVVRFTTHLNVAVPLMFAVTVERRGGVVVSDRLRIAAVAHSS